jgi:TolB-like protein/DNA-binding SARP family transcriptional activator
MSGYRLRLFGGIVLEGPTGAVTGRAAQKQRLGLLALLAAAPGRTLTRDRLMGSLWPERETEQARHLLSVAVYELRKALGDVIETRGDDVVLSRVVLTDLDRLEQARTAGDHAAAVAVVTGPFLDGFYLRAGEEFERWVADQRDRQARLHAADLERLADMHEARAEWVAAVGAWRRLAAVDPYSGRIALRLMNALERAGDRAAALRQARVHETLLREEFGAEPDPEIVTFAERLRTEPVSPELARTTTSGLPFSGARNAAGSAGPDPTTPSAGSDGAVTSAPLLAGQQPRTAAAVPPQSGVQQTPATWALEQSTAAGGTGGPVAGARRTVRARPARPVQAAVVATLAVVLVLLLWKLVPWGPVASAEPRAPPSLAVLPFHDLSGEGPDRQDFADGVVEDLLDALQSLKGLRVIDRNASFGFRGDVDLREVASRLGVTHLLTGSVRGAGGRIMVNVRLVNADTRSTVWSGKYEPSASDMSDIIGMQEEIARAVAAELRVQFEQDLQKVVRFATHDLEAWELYAEGRRLLQQREPTAMKEALARFQAAAQKDSTYARAYAGIADVYTLLGAFNYGMMPPQQAAALALREVNRALRLEPELAEAHAVLAAIRFNYQRDWVGAEESFRHALALNPGLGQAWHWFSLFLSARERWGEAREAVARMRDYDPTSPVAATASARAAYYQRDFDNAIEGFNRVVVRDPTFLTALLRPRARLRRVRPDRRRDHRVRARCRARAPRHAGCRRLVGPRVRRRRQGRSRA